MYIAEAVERYQKEYKAYEDQLKDNSEKEKKRVKINLISFSLRKKAIRLLLTRLIMKLKI